jgi:hypothetical protein
MKSPTCSPAAAAAAAAAAMTAAGAVREQSIVSFEQDLATRLQRHSSGALSTTQLALLPDTWAQTFPHLETHPISKLKFAMLLQVLCWPDSCFSLLTSQKKCTIIQYHKASSRFKDTSALLQLLLLPLLQLVQAVLGAYPCQQSAEVLVGIQQPTRAAHRTVKVILQAKHSTHASTHQ